MDYWEGEEGLRKQRREGIWPWNTPFHGTNSICEQLPHAGSMLGAGFRKVIRTQEPLLQSSDANVGAGGEQTGL